MEKKNTILLTVIAVATLLVAVVGATFAYFTATTTADGTGAGTSDVGTAKVSGVNLDYEPIENGIKKLEYPGGFAYAGIKLGLTKQDATDTKNYTVSYKVKMEFKNTTETELTWTLYRAASATEITNNRTCEVSNAVPEGQSASAVYYAYNCTGDNTYGESVQTGKIAPNTATATEVITTLDESLRTDAATGYYYYLVVDYPNNGNQNNDQGKVISASITGVSDVKQAVAS